MRACGFSETYGAILDQTKWRLQQYRTHVTAWYMTHGCVCLALPCTAADAAVATCANPGVCRGGVDHLQHVKTCDRASSAALPEASMHEPGDACDRQRRGQTIHETSMMHETDDA